MAGGKETPRQKMIGMMYLVLTALLALQIKDTVLEKFVLIENGLKVSNESFMDYNQNVLTSIQNDVTNQGEKDGDVAVQKVAEQVRLYTLDLANYLDNLKLELGKVSTGGDTSKIYERSTLKKYEEPSNYLVNKKNAEELKRRLDEYPLKVNEIISLLGKGGMNPEWMKSIAIDANDIKFYENNAEAKKEDYAHFNFYKAPLASVLAQLTFYKNQIFSKESEALNKLKGMVGTAVSTDPNSIPTLADLVVTNTQPASQPDNSSSEDEAAPTPRTTPRQNPSSGTASAEISQDEFLKGAFAGIDYAQATVLSESNIVTAGLDFSAQAFLTLGNSKLQPEIKVNGQDIPVVNGRGIISIPASAQNSEYDANGLAQKFFEVEITAQDGSGGTITRTKRHEYQVAKPVIDVRSASVEVLYLGCANNLNINVPALGPAYQPSFKVTGGTFNSGSQKGEILVVPTQRELKIDVSSGGFYIGSREFQAKPVPLPRLEVRPNGQPYDAKNGMDEKPTVINLLLQSDPDFAERYKDDATFLVSKGSVTLARGKTTKGVIPIDKPMSRVDLSQLVSRMASGDRIVVYVEEIVRFNYKEEQIPIRFTGDVTININ
ncbi:MULTISPECIES: GldM family protein [unclassified Roseivirga]|jgi:hypothetical protein|uniref:type IX secretion system motor protein PorM/GldM n=1 Tax=unclassified Roseivirga TaxID=2626142 RepID=UPI00257C4773|nr:MULTISPECIES: GldM family protein [unclassified Roseivirga]MEC7752831.1 GldM family protein [Bacteroidota bacterium]|tara:strand:+ start:5337 stop:7148 length:1812 start_codon:yes stop_codon:yes gene_type:complete